MRRSSGWSESTPGSKYGRPLGQQRGELGLELRARRRRCARSRDAARRSRSTRPETAAIASRIAAGLRRSTLLSAITTGAPVAASCSAMKRSPPPETSLASSTSSTASTSRRLVVDRALHAARERVERLLEPRQVDEHDLEVVAVHDAERALPRRLRLVGDDRDVRAGERVRERRLADVRAARETDEPAAHRSAPQLERGRQQRGERLGDDLALAAVDDQQIEAELGQELAAGAARRAGLRRVVRRRRRSRVKRRAPSLTARTQALRSAQIVRPMEPFSTLTPSKRAPILGDQHGAHGELRVRRVGALAHLAGPLVQRELGGRG